MTPQIEPYRIGHGAGWALASVPRLYRYFRTEECQTRRGALRRTRSTLGEMYRRSSDRWRRCWQAEWDGCTYAVRAWTRRGVERRARRCVRPPTINYPA